MKKISSFKEFVKPGILTIPEIIHFKMGKADPYKRTPEGHIIIDEPIHFKHTGSDPKLMEDASSSTKTPLDTDHTNIPKNGTPDKHGNLENDHNKLSNRLRQRVPGMTQEDRDAVHRYTKHNTETNTAYSKSLNDSLIKGEKPSRSDEKMHNAIKAHVHKAGEDVHLYSGTNHDFSETAKKSKDGILHSPAHISATHSHRTASNFADDGGKPWEEPRHIVHIHVKPHDKILHVSGVSELPHERESIIPSGTNLKYSHSTRHYHGLRTNVNVHHFTIHSQE